MLCSLCSTFVNDVLNQDFGNWKRKDDEVARRQGDDWYSFKHRHGHDMQLSAHHGCEVCSTLFDARLKVMPEWSTMSEKWIVQHSLVDCNRSEKVPLRFYLYTNGSTRSVIPFDLFAPEELDRAITLVTIDRKDSLHNDSVGLVPLLRALPDSPTSARRFETAKDWIYECAENHSACERPASTPLPTRVVDVGPADGSIEPKLYVSHGQSRPYVTLSHCWGASNTPVTTWKTLKKHENAIPMSTLPATIRDAITIVRRLGEKYVWIDSLCIVQDSRQDWETEAAKMCSIYENSLFCISALDSTDGESGILHHHNLTTSEFDTERETIATLGIRCAPQSFSEAISSCVLSSRAWCLQERILAPALLHFSRTQMYWECGHGEASEAQPTLSVTASGRTTFASGIIPDVRGSNLSVLSWHDIVESYSSRSLTYHTDRLPAILGLARKYSQTGRPMQEYHFGLWMDDIDKGILWQTAADPRGRSQPAVEQHEPKRSTKVYHKHVAIAPSWSWASVTARVEWGLLSSSARGKIVVTQKDAVINGPFPLPTRGHREPLSALNSYLSITGLLKRGICKTLMDSPTQSSQHRIVFKPYASYPDARSLCIKLDNVHAPINVCYCVRIVSWSDIRTNRPVDRIFYLILERHNKQTTNTVDGRELPAFRRIGVGDDIESREAVFVNAERQEITLY